MSDLGLYTKWIISKSDRTVKSKEDLKERIINLGNYLKNSDYFGYDVKVGYPAAEISTVYSSSLIGWFNLYSITSENSFLENSKFCLNKIIESQDEKGCWLFPYAFRKNPPNYPYSCENFMTLRALLFAYDNFGKNKRIANSIEKNINFLSNNIGFQNGIFWYSAADKIEVPNISSMAANAFSRASVILNNPKFLEQSKMFAEYCITNQDDDGAYPYYTGDPMVVISYHALEIWELIEANKIIKDTRIQSSIEKAVIYLESYLNKYGYLTSYPSSYLIRRNILFKTPVWGAKAFLYANDIENALKHFKEGLYIFKVPNKDIYFHTLKEYGLPKLSVKYPLFSSQFIRYNASAFEIGSTLLKKME